MYNLILAFLTYSCSDFLRQLLLWIMLWCDRWRTFGSWNIKIANVPRQIFHHCMCMDVSCSWCWCQCAAFRLFFFSCRWFGLLLFDSKMQRTLKEVKLFVFSRDNIVSKFSIWSYVTTRMCKLEKRAWALKTPTHSHTYIETLFDVPIFVHFVILPAIRWGRCVEREREKKGNSLCVQASKDCSNEINVISIFLWRIHQLDATRKRLPS